MAAPADVVFENGTIHTLTDPDETADAVAVRDGRVQRVCADYESQFATGVETRVVDLEGRILLPGFVDAHTHMQQLGQYQVHADLSEAGSIDDVVSLLEASAADEDASDDDWLLGFGYDESGWSGERRYPTREDLDAVATDRPIAAFRVDMHSASLDSTALDRLGDDLPDEDVRTEGGRPTGVVVERAAEAVWASVEPDRERTRELVDAAIGYAHRQGVTAVHDMVRNSYAPHVYRELDAAGELPLRVRLNYWADHLDAVAELGLRTNHGSESLRVGAIKSFSDGSVGSRTATVTEPYADDPDETGTWTVPPAELEAVAADVADAGLQMSAHAIGDAAVDAVLSAYEAVDQPAARHRIEHAELLDDDLIERMAAAGTVASVQPNFLAWADPDGLYDQRLGDDRRRRMDPFRLLLDAGVPLAFGSDCMPMDPLYGVHLAVNAPVESQRLDVTAALRAYTSGAAYAGFDEGRMGTIEPGKLADFVVLDRSPWAHPESIDDVEVVMTVVGGEIVYDAR